MSYNGANERANLFLNDALLFNIASALPANLLPGFEDLGAFVASSEARNLAKLANEYRPKLVQTDQWGNKQQAIELHPAYHALLRRSKLIGLTSSIWENRPEHSNVRYQARAIGLFLLGQLEAGHLCEITTTSAGIAAVSGDSDLYRQWQKVLLSRQHDTSSRPIEQKKGISFALALDEDENDASSRKICQAEFLTYHQQFARNIFQIRGTKARVANPNADAIFVTAELDGGLSCFLVPQFNFDGTRNNMEINYLLEENGYRSRPIAEVVFGGSSAWLVGQASDGAKIVNDIETMVRFDEVVISAAALRTSLQFALDLLRRSETVRSPLTTRIFADLALDIAAAQTLVMRLARAFDSASQDRGQAAFARIMTPVISFWINSLVLPVISEIIGQLGSIAYQENGFLPRFQNDSAIRFLDSKNTNRLVLDVIRSAERAPKLFEEIIMALGSDIGAAGSRTVEVLRAAAQIAMDDVGSGRILIEQLAYAAAAAALNATDMSEVSNAFIESRLGGQWRTSYGMLSARHHAGHILETLYPVV